MAFSKPFPLDAYRGKSTGSFESGNAPDSYWVHLPDDTPIDTYPYVRYVNGVYNSVIQNSNINYTISPRSKVAVHDNRGRGLKALGFKPAKSEQRLNQCFHVKSRSWVDDPRYEDHHLVNDYIIPGHPESGYAKALRFLPFPGYSHAFHEQGVAAAMAAIPIRNGRLGYDGDIFSNLCNQAMAQMRPTLRVADIGEDLLQASESLTKLSELLVAAPHWRRKLPTAVRRNIGKKLNIRRRYSGSVLQYNFAWKPFISNVKEVFKGLAGMLQRIQVWQERVALGLPTISSRDGFATGPSGIWSGSIDYGDDYGSVLTWSVSQSSSIGATVIYTPRPIEQLQPLLDMFRGGLASLGLELNPRIIWDLIPFSFVIDWFTNVGDVLDSMRIDALELPFEMLDFCLSFRERLSITTQLTQANSVFGLGSFVEPFVFDPWHTEISIFDRYPMSPFIPGRPLVGWKQTTDHQITLGLNLISANL
jgi:hypothetical protein